ncbi:hypothetical protein F6Y05_35425 [Bacillus megaterium]|nr:hypothetical protein [Priestia megaterium]
MDWNIIKIPTNNGYRIGISQEQDGWLLEEDLTEEEAIEKLGILTKEMNVPKFDNNSDILIDEGIPFLGILSQNGYTEYYDELTAEKNDFHHSFCLSEEGLEKYDNDNTLRFIYYLEDNLLNIKGNAALDPFNKGKILMRNMTKLLIEKGIPSDASVFVENHYLNTQYEGKIIGKLYNFK